MGKNEEASTVEEEASAASTEADKPDDRPFPDTDTTTWRPAPPTPVPAERWGYLWSTTVRIMEEIIVQTKHRLHVTPNIEFLNHSGGCRFSFQGDMLVVSGNIEVAGGATFPKWGGPRSEKVSAAVSFHLWSMDFSKIGRIFLHHRPFTGHEPSPDAALALDPDAHGPAIHHHHLMHFKKLYEHLTGIVALHVGENPLAQSGDEYNVPAIEVFRNTGQTASGETVEIRELLVRTPRGLWRFGFQDGQKLWTERDEYFTKAWLAAQDMTANRNPAQEGLVRDDVTSNTPDFLQGPDGTPAYLHNN